MKKGIILILIVLIFSSISVFAQDNESYQGGTAASIQQIGNKTIITQQVTSSDLQFALDDINSRLQILESRPVQQPSAQPLPASANQMPAFDYLSIVNLILIIILFFITIGMRKKPESIQQ